MAEGERKDWITQTFLFCALGNHNDFACGYHMDAETMTLAVLITGTGFIAWLAILAQIAFRKSL